MKYMNLFILFAFWVITKDVLFEVTRVEHVDDTLRFYSYPTESEGSAILEAVPFLIIAYDPKMYRELCLRLSTQTEVRLINTNNIWWVESWR